MFDRPVFRRTVSLGVVLIGLPLWILAAPLWVAVSLIVDIAGRLWRFPTLRLCLFGAIYLAHEWLGMVAALGLWLTGSFGRSLNMPAHRGLQAWWAMSLLRWAGRLLGVQIDMDNPTGLPPKTFVLLSRHASMVDAVIPIVLVAGGVKRYVHYVLKKELRWVPALDIFGDRLRNHFVTRGRDTESEEQAITDLAVDAYPDSGLVIFPEGTYATPQSRERVLTSLRRIGDAAVVARAEALQVLLPPKPAGSLALLRGQPDADVVIVGHVGLGGAAELRGLRSRLPLTKPVIVRWWTHPRQDLPSTEEGLSEWLAERWQELDRWVIETRAAR